ncbi:MAG: N-acetyltransferase domain-containing protein [Oscillospiraceae bacterium]
MEMITINTSKDTAITYLQKNPILHADMLECIRRGSAQILAASDFGVLLYESGVHMLSAENETEAYRLLSKLNASELMVIHQAYGTEFAMKKYGFSRRIPACNAVYLRGVPLPQNEKPAEIRPLDESFLPFVKAHYQNISEDEYLLDRLKAGVVFGAFIGGEPAGFIGIHTEGSIGMLEVLPKFRRRGIARILESFQVNRLLQAGCIPYAQIQPQNKASIELHRKLGFSFSDFSVSWLLK